MKMNRYAKIVVTVIAIYVLAMATRQMMGH